MLLEQHRFIVLGYGETTILGPVNLYVWTSTRTWKTNQTIPTASALPNAILCLLSTTLTITPKYAVHQSTVPLTLLEKTIPNYVCSAVPLVHMAIKQLTIKSVSISVLQIGMAKIVQESTFVSPSAHLFLHSTRILLRNCACLPALHPTMLTLPPESVY